MLHLEFNITRRHIYGLVAAIAVIVMMVPLASYAADRFTDVPDSNVFHDDITWLADAGVTLGCNPPANDEFCPTDNVRRETMAAFMRRLAVNQVVDAKTAIDAENAVNADFAASLTMPTCLREAPQLNSCQSWPRMPMRILVARQRPTRARSK